MSSARCALHRFQAITRETQRVLRDRLDTWQSWDTMNPSNTHALGHYLILIFISILLILFKLEVKLCLFKGNNVVKNQIQQCATYCVRIAEVENNLIRRCDKYRRIAGLLTNCNSAMARLAGALPSLKLIHRLWSPRLEIGSVAAKPSHGFSFCGSHYHFAAHSAKSRSLLFSFY